MAGRAQKREILELFSGYYAEATDDGTFFVRERGILKSPHEYSEVSVLTRHSYALTRAREPKVDILFSDLSWFLGAVEVGVLDYIGGDDEFALLLVFMEDGSIVMTDNGREIIYVRGYPLIALLENKLIAVYDPEPHGPYVRVYDMNGELISEGLLWDAQREALKKIAKRQRT